MSPLNNSNTFLGLSTHNVIAHAKRALTMFTNLQFKVIEGYASNQPFSLPTVGLIDPTNPAEVGKIEVFNQFLSSSTTVVTNMLTKIKSIEDELGKQLH
jgi:hypothetical protein